MAVALQGVKWRSFTPQAVWSFQLKMLKTEPGRSFVCKSRWLHCSATAPPLCDSTLVIIYAHVPHIMGGFAHANLLGSGACQCSSARSDTSFSMWLSPWRHSHGVFWRIWTRPFFSSAQLQDVRSLSQQPITKSPIRLLGGGGYMKNLVGNYSCSSKGSEKLCRTGLLSARWRTDSLTYGRTLQRISFVLLPLKRWLCTAVQISDASVGETAFAGREELCSLVEELPLCNWQAWYQGAWKGRLAYPSIMRGAANSFWSSPFLFL